MTFKVGDKVRFTQDNPNGGSQYGRKGQEAVVHRVYDHVSPPYGKQVELEPLEQCEGFEPDAPISALELIGEEQGMRLKNGEFYRTRGGRRAGPAKLHSKAFDYWDLGDEFDVCHNGDGRYLDEGEEHENDLVALWQDEPTEPVFTVGAKVRRIAYPHSFVPIGYEATITEVNGDILYYVDADGDLMNSSVEYWELVSPTGPVRTVTRTVTEIVEGQYGRIRVCSHLPNAVLVGFTDGSGDWDYTSLTASELKAAAAVLLELAGALSDGE